MPTPRFKRLLKAVQQMKAIQRGALRPGRVTVVTSGGRVRRSVDPEAYRKRQAKLKAVSVSEVRENLGLSQQELADLLGISRRTLENWEQGRREPTGAAKVLLRVAERHPEAVLEAVA
ncbi:MAG TPA: helix-turn-helix domain-containing protein [Opitutaceae bacterium]|nr:helix-turn-helix domain-containing protein [Opitutaceae bacterium]